MEKKVKKNKKCKKNKLRFITFNQLKCIMLDDTTDKVYLYKSEKEKNHNTLLRTKKTLNIDDVCEMDITIPLASMSTTYVKELLKVLKKSKDTSKECKITAAKYPIVSMGIPIPMRTIHIYSKEIMVKILNSPILSFAIITLHGNNKLKDTTVYVVANDNEPSWKKMVLY